MTNWILTGLNACYNVSKRALSFGLNSILNTLPTQVNLNRWYPVVSDTCKRCGIERQTLGHILCYCSLENMESEDPRNRVTWRHNSILKMLSHHLLVESSELPIRYIDLANNPDYYESFPEHILPGGTTLRPDLILEYDEEIILIELTSCMNNRINYWHTLKTQKYTRLTNDISLIKKCSLFAIEVSAVGLVSASTETLLSHLKMPKHIKKRIKSSLSQTALECSKEIFSYRNRTEWPHSNL